jgi:NADH:quinone reductase (non-electrogenic)
VADQEARGGTLILGGGFAGGWVARLLRRQGATVVSPENFMLYTLMCPHAELRLGRAVALDERRRRVQVEAEERLYWIRYRTLVIALGSISRTLPIPGLADYGHGFRDLPDAIALRNHVLGRLEIAAAAPTEAHRRRELTFVFVGAGYAGVEALAELSDLVRDAVRHYPELRGEPQRWVIVDAASTILPEIPRRLGHYAGEELTRRGVEIHTGTTLAAAERHAVELSDGTRILTSTLVWTAGVRANPALEQLGLALDERGRIPVDETLRVRDRDGVFALGDCAQVPNAATPDHPDPPTSQHALRQARCVVRNLRGQPKPYRYRMLGQVATLGRYKGIADIFGVHLRGFPGWWVTRTYHLYQLPLFSRKLRVVTDWTVALLFRRDIAELGMLGHPRRLSDD